MGAKSRTAGTGGAVEEAAARQALRDQIARLDGELAALGAPLATPAGRPGRGAFLLGLAALEPERHRFARVTNEAIGEPGCRDWHVRPRFGLLGMLAGWWRVVVSSGCPLPQGAGGPGSLGSTS
jgi:hypothetical protein